MPFKIAPVYAIPINIVKLATSNFSGTEKRGQVANESAFKYDDRTAETVVASIEIGNSWIRPSEPRHARNVAGRVKRRPSERRLKAASRAPIVIA
jgi:hypothetical protein